MLNKRICSLELYLYILIPPSEGKNPSSDKEYFSLDSLSYDFLNKKRSQIIDYLCNNNLSKEKYVKILGISSQNFEKINMINSKIKTSQVLSSISRYTGVLYDFLDFEYLKFGCGLIHTNLFAANYHKNWMLPRHNDCPENK